MNPHYSFVAARAKHICEYCQAFEAVFNLPFEVEHITPLSRGGNDDENNLALSFRSCNLYKSNSVSAFADETEIEVRLFNPREDIWVEHFIREATTGEIKDLTSIGKVTISRLRMNNKRQIAARASWVKLGLIE